MGTSTARLGLFKPDVTDLMSDVNNHLNANLDKIDAALPFNRVGSDPGTPFTGQCTLRSDLSDKAQIREAAAWREWQQYYTPISVQTETDVTTASTSYVTGATILSTTFTAPPSGRVWVNVSAFQNQSAAYVGYCSFEIRLTDSAGAIFLAAADDQALESKNTNGVLGTMRTLVTGLTPLTQTYYIRTMIRSQNAAGTYTAAWRRLEIERRQCA